MFDVIWTDPDRELLGEHRAKKEKKKRDQKEKGKNRSSMSTKRSSLSSTDSPFSFLRSHGLKRINTSEANSNSKSTTSSRLASPSVSSARSRLSDSFDSRSRPSSGLAATCSSDEPGSACKPVHDKVPVGGDSSSALLRHDSIFSKYAQSDAGTSRSVAEGSSSFENSRSAQSQVNNVDGLRDANRPPTNSGQAVLSQSPEKGDRTHYENATWPRFARKLRSVRNVGPNYSVVLVPGPISPSRPRRIFKPNSPEAWKTPDQRTGTFENSSPSPTLDVLADMLSQCSPTRESAEPSLDIKAWREEIERMSTTRLEDILANLNEICGVPPNQEFCIGHEAEGMRWMLWAITHLDPTPAHDYTIQRNSDISSEDSNKLLVLYEPQDTTAYLAALHRTKQIHHLSTTPLTSSFSSNIHPLPVPSTHPSIFPSNNNDNTYDSIISLTLPSLLPAPDIPTTLSNAASLLRPGSGTFRLLLIDPIPRSGTLGRHMRAWLHNHLLSNLERSFRCASPSRLFPDWLADAGLRGQGSTITTTKFFAIPACARLQSVAAAAAEQEQEENHFIDPAQNERVVKAEVRSLVGRLLWKHVWGDYVTGDRWWWDDPICVSECLEFGTIWEYHLIEGVKDE